MTESEGIQEAVKWAASQAAAVIIMVLRGADVGSNLTQTANLRELQ